MREQLLQPLERRVKGRFLQLKAVVGESRNDFVDFVAVAVAAKQPRQNDGVGMPPYQITGNRHRHPSLREQYNTKYLVCQGTSYKINTLT